MDSSAGAGMRGKKASTVIADASRSMITLVRYTVSSPPPTSFMGSQQGKTSKNGIFSAIYVSSSISFSSAGTSSASGTFPTISPLRNSPPSPFPPARP